jgi:CBS domain-containing protein
MDEEAQMRVEEIMTKDPACCSPDTTLVDVARMMVDHDCGEIPVVQNKKPVGVVTDRDITARVVAAGRNPLDLTARDCMSSPVITVTTGTSVDDCCKTMEQHQIRRVPVVDASGCCCGMVAQADIAKHAPPREVAEVVREVSQPGHAPMRA